MKRKIVLVISLAFGLAAAVLTRLYVTAKEAEVQAQKDALGRRYGTMDVLVYAKETPGGTVLAAEDLVVRRAPALGLRGQALTRDSLRDIVGRPPDSPWAARISSAMRRATSCSGAT